MRNALSTMLATLLCLGALALGACGGESQNRPEITWRASDGLPLYTSHWWWEAPERACEEDDDCRSGERCQLMRLGTCPACPRGEDARVCIPRDGSSGTSGNAARANR